MTTLENIEKDLKDNLEKAEKEVFSFKLEVGNTQLKVSGASARTNIVEASQATIDNLNKSRKAVISTIERMVVELDSTHKQLEPVELVLLKMAKDQADWEVELIKHQADIGGVAFKNKELLEGGLKDFLKPLAEIKTSWKVLAEEVAQLMGVLEATKGIPDLLAKQKDKIKNDFAEPFSDAQAKTVKDELKKQEKNLEEAQAKQKGNEENIAQLKQRLKNF
jgi:chromosome segregation ATPase